MNARLLDIERWASKIDVQPNGCWRWTGTRMQSGYGYLRVGSRLVRAHRWAYQVLVRDLAPEVHLDHTCHDPRTCTTKPCLHRSCVNPSHLEPVSQAENNRRASAPRALSTSCRRGHPRTAENTCLRGDGSRECLVCARERWHRRQQ